MMLLSPLMLKFFHLLVVIVSPFFPLWIVGMVAHTVLVEADTTFIVDNLSFKTSTRITNTEQRMT